MTIKVLLLEAHEDCRVAYADLLRAGGFEVSEVSDSRAALDIAATFRPRLIVAGFDSAMRDDRLRFCRELKQDRRTEKVAVVLTSEHVGREDLRLATAVGALALTVTAVDGAKPLAALRGVLAAQQRVDPPVLSSRLSPEGGCDGRR